MEELRGRLAAHGASYDVAMRWDDAQLRLQLREPAADASWSAHFSAQYIEEITKKTGNFKKFAVFLKMLQAAISEHGESVFVDILTHADLHALKSRKGIPADGAQMAAHASSDRSQKRYIILTYAAQFDRVHYPLPLAPENNTAAHSTDPTSTEAELGAGPETRRLRQGACDALSESTSKQLNELLREKEELQAAYERLQAETSRQLSKMRRKCEGLNAALQEQKDLVAVLQAENASQQTGLRSIEYLQTKMQRLEQDRRDETGELKQALDKHKKEVAMVILLNSEVSRSKREEERLRRHVRQLEAELKMMQRRAAAGRGARDRLDRGSSDYSGAFPSARVGSTSRPSSRVASAEGSRNTSRGGSRAASVASGSANSSRGASRPSSRPSSRPGSLPGSRERSAPTSRSSSTERTVPPALNRRYKPAGATPSLGHAAREALQQTSHLHRPLASRTNKERGSSPLAQGPLRKAEKERIMTKVGRSDVSRYATSAGRWEASSDLDDDEWNRRGESRYTKSSGPSTASQAAKRMSKAQDSNSHKENIDARFESRCDSMLNFSESAVSHHDVTHDIQDIDRRLSALQTFLKTARVS